MTRRTFLVPLFAAALILAPSPLSGQSEGSPQTAVWSLMLEAQG